MDLLFIAIGRYDLAVTVYPNLAKGCNWLLLFSAALGIIKCVFAVLGANYNGRWDEAKPKIGAYFLLILGPLLVKLVWGIIEESSSVINSWQ
jgi:hypothetical protein